jgi:hypothetical protein
LPNNLLQHPLAAKNGLSPRAIRSHLQNRGVCQHAASVALG